MAERPVTGEAAGFKDSAEAATVAYVALLNRMKQREVPDAAASTAEIPAPRTPESPEVAAEKPADQQE